MPHIIVEATQRVHRSVEWRRVSTEIHIELASKGYGNLTDFKSRVALTDDWVVADKEEPCDVLFATLHTMNPRPDDVLQAMTHIVHEHLSQALERCTEGTWVQCCVRAQATARNLYIKTHVSPPVDLESQFNYLPRAC